MNTKLSLRRPIGNAHTYRGIKILKLYFLAYTNITIEIFGKSIEKLSLKSAA
jgi:hypothetical protein